MPEDVITSLFKGTIVSHCWAYSWLAVNNHLCVVLYIYNLRTSSLFLFKSFLSGSFAGSVQFAFFGPFGVYLIHSGYDTHSASSLILKT